MCGLAGYANVRDPAQRAILSRALALGTDTRGRHAAGYVSSDDDGRIRYGTCLGPWAGASRAFRTGASAAPMTILHGRYATCGVGDVREAHPFAIRREGRVVLYGVHNGQVYDAEASAMAHDRPYDVDSRELFHLLADGEYDGIREMTGYGTVAWLRKDERDRVYLSRLTDDGDLAIARTACGATVFSSTEYLLRAALGTAGMRIEMLYEPPEAGTVLALHRSGALRHTDYPEVRLASWADDLFADDPPCPTCHATETFEYGGDWYCINDCPPFEAR